MLEILVWSVFVGSLGIEAVAAGGWLRWRQIALGKQHQEEEEILTDHQPNRNSGTVETLPPSLQSPGGKTQEKSSATGKNEEQFSDLGSAHPQLNGASAGQPLNPLLGEWEYKIVRASFDLFRDPDTFQRLCEEEGQAGWMLLEKLDDRRVRFKRPIAWRNMLNPEVLKFDPYRCHYGPTTGMVNLLGAIAAVTAMVLPAYLGYVLVSNTLAKAVPKIAPPPAPVFQESSPEPPTIP